MVDEGDCPGAVPPCPNGLFIFAPGASIVDDPDEEIMELYMNLASTSPDIRARPLDDTSKGSTSALGDADTGGLGFLDSNSSILELSIDLLPAATVASPVINKKDKESGSDKRGGNRSKRTVYKTDKRSESISKGKSVEVSIQQDLGALKGRRGDTGSVLWRSSLHLARHLLFQHHYPPNANTISLLDPDRLSSASILELGAGTGLLAVLLSQICGSYTASDRLENLKLVKRNLELNEIPIGEGSAKIRLPDTRHVSEGSNSASSGSGSVDGTSKATTTATKRGKSLASAKKAVHLEEIDWVAVSQQRKTYPLQEETDPQKYDIVLAVDCIYNEHLVQPLVDTLARYCPKGGKSVVWVVVELRSADVLTLFLERWTSDPSGPWTIVRLGEEAMGGWQGTRARWVGWVGWR
ncbi:hypothetical protein IAU59_004631 [Kwoniella sp. CBS 9459]